MTSKTFWKEYKQKAEPKKPTIEQKIYSTNDPLYNQATDLAIVRANYKRFKSFRKVLVERIRRQNAERVSHVKCLCESYDKNCREWLKKMEKKECTTIKKAKDQKLRDYFEWQFQELRKQRDDKERLQ
ncbi:nuclear receptor corepressor 2 [Tyrophagus putrescentiae]|nr:nuclear receptor corepressor 2 [Tyrophagus putrescentiae]